MVVESNQSIEELKQQKKRGEDLLLLAEFCRKLETQEEKVLPWPPTSLSTVELEAISDAIDEASTAKGRGGGGGIGGGGEGDVLDSMAGSSCAVNRLADHFLHEMNLFWRRVAKVHFYLRASDSISHFQVGPLVRQSIRPCPPQSCFEGFLSRFLCF